MLYRLEIENYSSIRDPQILDLTIAPNVPDHEGRFTPIFPGSSLRVPKVVAIYGANASGKTTVLKALASLFQFIGGSASDPQRGVPMFPFNDKEHISKPIRLAIEFGTQLNLRPEMDTNKTVVGCMRYELELEAENGRATKVLSETLRQRPDGKGKWQRIFERDITGIVLGSSNFQMSNYGHLVKTLRENASVLSSFAFFDHPNAKIYADTASRVWLYFKDRLRENAALEFLAASPAILEKLNADLNRIDIGIESLKFDPSANGPQALFTHAGLQSDLGWQFQSQGTKEFIKVFPTLALTLEQGSVGIIDEFDTLFHPLMLPEILSWFYNKSRNPLNAQVWLSCHSASLMDDLCKEEIVITEKDFDGRTSIFSLMDIKDVRRGDNLAKKYLGGVYGGVPTFG